MIIYIRRRIVIKNLLILTVLLITTVGCAQKSPTVTSTPEVQNNTENTEIFKRWTFSRSFSGMEDMKPRGGTSKGAPVVYESSPNRAYLSISEPGISKYEQDRRAILAMVGTFKVSFDFVETVALRPGYELDRPYQSWATEIVEVIEDSGDFISLQHILVMYFINDGGETEGPVIVKHWRQDWRYEDTEMLEFRGNNTWENVPVTAGESSGKWTQAVFQVDDSPRYESIGEWVHDGNYSSWTSAVTWRPLPRREFSVRDDYGVLEAMNRHIVTPTGWVHEQDNIKLVIDENGKPVSQDPYIAKEAGFNRYDRITGDEYDPGFEYWEKTGEFWGDVRGVWSEVLTADTVRLKSKHDGKNIYEYMFEYAGEVEESGAYDSKAGTKFAEETIELFIVPQGGMADKSVY